MGIIVQVGVQVIIALCKRLTIFLNNCFVMIILFISIYEF